MIRYALQCQHEHDFESWFRDSRSFDHLADAGMVSCPDCGSTAVRKALMAPAVRTRSKAAAPIEAAGEDKATSRAIDDPKAQQLRALARSLRNHLAENSTDVGALFAEEARKIHEGTSAARTIHGTASAPDVKALLEDGIGVLPLPVLPEDRN